MRKLLHWTCCAPGPRDTFNIFRLSSRVNRTIAEQCNGSLPSSTSAGPRTHKLYDIRPVGRAESADVSTGKQFRQ